jgi:hypothetical protein
MIKLNFTKDEMITTLQKIGYEVKKEETTVTRRYYHTVEDISVYVYNVYYKGVRIDLWDYLYGTDRLTNVFEQEVRKRVLSLF